MFDYICCGIVGFVICLLLWGIADYIDEKRESEGVKLEIDLTKFTDDEIVRLAFIDKVYGLPNENYFDRIIKPQYKDKNVDVYRVNLDVLNFTSTSARKYVIQTMVNSFGEIEYFIKDNILYCFGEYDTEESVKAFEITKWLSYFGAEVNHMLRYRVDSWKKIFEDEHYGRNVD
jgi:hypothetical protein